MVYHNNNNNNNRFYRVLVGRVLSAILTPPFFFVHLILVLSFFLLLLLVAAASSVGLAAAEFVALVVLLMWRCLEFKKSWGELSNMRKGLLSTGPYAACSAFPLNNFMFVSLFLSRTVWGARGGDVVCSFFAVVLFVLLNWRCPELKNRCKLLSNMTKGFALCGTVRGVHGSSFGKFEVKASVSSRARRG